MRAEVRAYGHTFDVRFAIARFHLFAHFSGPKMIKRILSIILLKIRLSAAAARATDQHFGRPLSYIVCTFIFSWRKSCNRAAIEFFGNMKKKVSTYYMHQYLEKEKIWAMPCNGLKLFLI